MHSSAKITNSPIRAVILDSSGTMFDDVLSTWNICNDVLVSCGKRPIGLEEFRENFELPYFQIFLKYGLSKEDSKLTSLRFFHDNYNLYEHLTKPFEHTKSCVESLSKAGYLLGIVSQTPKEMLHLQLEKMGLSWMIPNNCIAKGEVPQEKPLPLPLFEMIQRLGVSRHQVLYVGDTADDVFCAHYAGVESVAVANDHSYNNVKRLFDAKPNHIIDNLGALPRILMPEVTVMM